MRMNLCELGLDLADLTVKAVLIGANCPSVIFMFQNSIIKCQQLTGGLRGHGQKCFQCL